jgi:hypothetical protein
VELLLQLLVYVVKNDTLPPQIINLLPQLFIIRYGLVKLLIRFFKPIFQNSNLLVEGAGVLATGVDPSH